MSYTDEMDIQKGAKMTKKGRPKFDPLQMMWTDPITCQTFFEHLPDEEIEVLERDMAAVQTGIMGVFDAHWGHEKHPLARIAVIMALNVAAQAKILEDTGFELDELGSPVYDEDEEVKDDIVR